ncbi:DUF6879 family protein [Phytohabitans houttuyneae]|uniref:DUF6879 domain-containing protein n=1 Tax=Phytohabitans houttuyneae TaxID=1076126 RepID=A0A6V8KIF6_9ACTN|nr:DUF6879 family protein [Phytohabitans houttuyneae]GFJ84983.1 hypothetical protein Phou_091630 [Phytohabitans houttuyneae]
MRLVTAVERDLLLAVCKSEAVHLELRDFYSVAGDAERFDKFKKLGYRDLKAEAADVRPWTDLIRSVTQDSRTVRRARVVSEPVTEYIRYEWAGTAHIVAAGEDVRWLPRRLASNIALPGNDFWLFDDETLLFTVFNGVGDVAERQLTTDPAAVQLCRTAFEAVWALATPHSEYKPL